MTRVAVIGAGIAGLAAAYELKKLGAEPIVFDADAQPGGKVRTEQFDGIAIDTGPDSFLARRPEAVELCRELGLGTMLAPPAATTAFVYSRGALRRLPTGLVLGVPTDPVALARSGILSPLGTLRAAVEPFVPGAPLAGDVALGGLIRRRFGREVADRLVDPLLGGINAGDIDELSVATVAPQIAAAARRDRSLTRALRGAPAPPVTGDPVFLTVPGGLADLVDALVDRAGDVRTGDAVHAVEPTRVIAASGEHAVAGVVVATPAYISADLVAPHAPGAAAVLRSVPYASVSMALFAYHASAIGRPLDASGYLVPKSERLLMTAASWASSKWRHLDRPGRVLLRVSAGRHGDDRASRMSDDELVGALRADLATTMQVQGEPDEVRVVRWPRSFPQYPPGHQARVAQALEEIGERAPWLALAGAALNGVGLPACIGSGRAAARAVRGAAV